MTEQEWKSAMDLAGIPLAYREPDRSLHALLGDEQWVGKPPFDINSLKERTTPGSITVVSDYAQTKDKPSSGKGFEATCLIARAFMVHIRVGVRLLRVSRLLEAIERNELWKVREALDDIGVGVVGILGLSMSGPLPSPPALYSLEWFLRDQLAEGRSLLIYAEQDMLHPMESNHWVSASFKGIIRREAVQYHV